MADVDNESVRTNSGTQALYAGEGVPINGDHATALAALAQLWPKSARFVIGPANYEGHIWVYVHWSGDVGSPYTTAYQVDPYGKIVVG